MSEFGPFFRLGPYHSLVLCWPLHRSSALGLCCCWSWKRPLWMKIAHCSELGGELLFPLWVI